MFEAELRRLEEKYAVFHPLEFALAMEQRSQQIRVEAVQQYKLSQSSEVVS